MATNLTPWGLWPTLGLGLAVIVAISLVEALGAIIYVATHDGHSFRTLATEGDFLAAILNLRTLLGVGLIALFCRLRHNLTVVEYLALHRIAWRTTVVWLGILAVFIGATLLLYHLLGRDATPEFMKQTYANTTWLPLLWITVVVTAPLFEEVFFRGFLFAGLQHSWLSHRGAIVFTALLFAVIHLQYDWPEMIVVFLLGIMLGVARWLSGSLYVPILLHATNNLAAMINVAYLQGQ